MPDEVLGALVDDHARFEGVFREVEQKLSGPDSPGEVDFNRLLDLVWFLVAHTKSFHQGIEEVIYYRLLDRLPHFSDDIYPVSGDHRECTRRGAVLSDAARTATPADQRSVRTLATAARSYISHERLHFIQEEEVFYPFARQHVRPEQWTRIAGLHQKRRARAAREMQERPRLRDLIDA